MSGPITWRNVNSPTGVAEAGALFQSAQKFFSDAFDTLIIIIKEGPSLQASSVSVSHVITYRH